MKSYKDIVDRLAEQAYSHYMNGDFVVSCDPPEILTWACDFDKKKMEADIRQAYVAKIKSKK